MRYMIIYMGAYLRQKNRPSWSVPSIYHQNERLFRGNFGLVTAAVVLTFALAAGLSATIYSAAHSVLLRPFPFSDPGRLLSIWKTTPGVDFVPLPAPELLDLRARSTTLQEVAGFEPGGFGVRLADQTVWADAFKVTANWFEVLGVRPILGRTFASGEDAPGHENVVVITEHFWRGELGGDPRVIGTSLQVSWQSPTGRGTSIEIIGVVRDDLELSYPTKLRPDAYVPRVFTAADLGEEARSSVAFITIARLRPDVTVADASEETRILMSALGREHPTSSIPNAGVRAVLLHDELVGRTRPMFLLLGAAALVLLIIAATNVGAVLLARVGERSGEMAVRAALGCSTSRLVRALLVEHLVLAALSASAAVMVSAWTIGVVRAIAPEVLPRVSEIRFDSSTVLFALAVTITGALAFGVAPALAVARHASVAHLSLRSEIAAPGRKRRLTGLLIVAETALVIVLLAGAASIGRGIWRLTHLDLGFDPKEVVIAQLIFTGSPDAQVLERQIMDRVRGVPGVMVVSASSELPFSSGVLLAVETSTTGENPRAVVAAIDPDYFALLQTSARRGRVLQSNDTGKRTVVVLNESLARMAATSGVIGGRVKVAGEWREVIGIVPDVTEVGSLRAGVIRQAGFTRLTLPTAYVPRETGFPGGRTFLLVRTTLPVVAAIRRAVHSVDPTILIRRTGTLEERVAAPGTDARFAAVIVATFGLAALLIASLGLYGLLTHAVGQRTREVAVRIALGATTTDVLRSITGGTLALVAAGLALGLASSVTTGPFLRPWLFEATSYDGPALIAAASLLLLVAMIATFLPARRLSRVNPIAALRTH
jgi:putative ABC transport system permease protein